MLASPSGPVREKDPMKRLINVRRFTQQIQPALRKTASRKQISLKNNQTPTGNQSTRDEGLNSGSTSCNEGLFKGRLRSSRNAYSIQRIEEAMVPVAAIADGPFNGMTSTVAATRNQQWSLNAIENYHLDKILGFGSFATVKLATFRGDNNNYAIKTYEKYKLVDSKVRKNVAREISLMKKLHHPSVIKLITSIETSKQIHLIMEYTTSTSLNGYLKTKVGRKISESEARILFRQLTEGICYLHELSIIHRDIKMENILVDTDTKQIKIIDLGFAIQVPDDKNMTIICGTPSYMAPEIIGKQGYKAKPTDVWALGIVLYYMLCGSVPFKGNDEKEIYKKIMKTKLEFPQHVSEKAEDMLRNILNPNPKERPTARDILEAPWMKTA